MRRIDIRDLPAQSDEEIDAGETYAVERDGRVVGYLVPFRRVDPEEARQAFAELDRVIDESLSPRFSQEQMADDLDVPRQAIAERS